MTVGHENSFEDLEQFFTHLDWASPLSSTDGSASDSDLVCEHSMQSQQDIQELEVRALKEHLKAIVKDIHIAIGEYSTNCCIIWFLTAAALSSILKERAVFLSSF